MLFSRFFPELLVWDLWIKTNSLYSQTTNKETNIFQSNFLKGFYLVSKGIKKKISVGLAPSLPTSHHHPQVPTTAPVTPTSAPQAATTPAAPSTTPILQTISPSLPHQRRDTGTDQPRQYPLGDKWTHTYLYLSNPPPKPHKEKELQERFSSRPLRY